MPDIIPTQENAPNVSPNTEVSLSEQDTTLNFDYKQAQMDSIIKIVGVGGGGGNAVKHMYNQGIRDVSFLLINTDRVALNGSPIADQLQIGPGLGAGAHPEVAKQYAIEHHDQIYEKLNDGRTEMVFITAGMGGGTGTGAAPQVAKIAKEMGLLTIGIVTIPFKFEGPKKINMALEGVKEIQKYVDALLIVNNNLLIDIYPDLNFINAFKKADDTLLVAARSISEIVTREGYINLDFADVRTTLKDSGVAIISEGYGEGEGRITQAFNNAVHSPLLLGRDIRSSSRLLFDLNVSQSNCPSMEEIGELNNLVNQFENEGIEVIWGVKFDEDLGDKVKIIILASGFNMDNNVSIETPKPQVDLPIPEISPNAAAINTSSISNEVVANPIVETVETMVAETHTLNEEIEKEENIEISASETENTDEPEVVKEKEEEIDNEILESAEIPQEEAHLLFEATTQEENHAASTSDSVAASTQEDSQPSANNNVIHVESESTIKTTVSSSGKTTETSIISTPSTYPQPLVATTVDEGIQNIRQYYGEEVAAGFASQRTRSAYYILNDNDLDNEQLIERLEQLPAYNRRPSDLSTLHEVTPEDINRIAGADGTIRFDS